MSAQDIEILTSDEFKKNDKTKLQRIYENIPFIRLLCRDIIEDSPLRFANNHCFKYTKLREDCYFIDCTLTTKRVDPETNITKEIVSNNTIIVNETSFWNRFSFYKSSTSNEKYKPKDNIDIGSLLTRASINNVGIDHIVLNVLPCESEQIENIDSKKNNFLDTNGFVNGASVKINDFYVFNKRVVIELFNPARVDLHVKDPVTTDVIKSYLLQYISRYTDKNSIMYYNPDDPGYTKYKLLYSK